MTNKLKDFWGWLVTSSQDPQKTGLLVRGALLWVVAQVLAMAPLLCQWANLCFDTGALSGLVDPIVGFVVSALSLLSYGMMVVGGLRKLWLSRWRA